MLYALPCKDKPGPRALADADPYAKAGLFEKVEVRPFRWTVNNPEG